MTTTEPLAPASDLDARITEALAELRGARGDYDHCPSTDNERTVEDAEWRLDQLFERRGAATRTKD